MSEGRTPPVREEPVQRFGIRNVLGMSQEGQGAGAGEGAGRTLGFTL